jgi:hypothetical protein
MAKYVSIGKAFEELTGTRPHPSTIWRWALKGSKGVTLKSWLVGGRRMTTFEAVQSFIDSRSAALQVTPSAESKDKVKRELSEMLK